MAEPGAVSVSNPLGDEKDEQDERSAAEGVPSPDFHRRLGPRLSTDEGKPTLLSLAAYASLSLVPLIFYLFGSATNHSVIYAIQERDVPAIVNRTFGGVLYWSFFYSFHALRLVTRKGSQLDQLGAGTELISQKATRSLRQWQLRLKVAQSAFLVVFFSVAVRGVVTGDGLQSSPWNRGSSVLLLVNFPLSMASVFTWWYTMKIAAALSTTKVQQTADRIKQWRELKAAAGPGEEAAVWREEIVKPVFRLAQVTMPTLSAGWGRPLLAISAGCLFIVLDGAFGIVFDADKTSFMQTLSVVMILLWGSLPLGLALEPARASSKCDRLVDSLNHVSLNELEENRDLWLSLDRVITTWNRTNRGQ